MCESIPEKIAYWKKVRKIAMFTMLGGFVAVVVCYFWIAHIDLMIGIWAVLVIVPYALHTIANRKLRRLGG